MTGNRFMPMGGAISSICGTSGGHGPQRLFAKNSFSSSIDISNATPVVPEDKELPPTKIAPPTRLSLGSESLGILSESIPSECDSPSATNRMSPEIGMRGVGASVSSSNSSINSGTFELMIRYSPRLNFMSQLDSNFISLKNYSNIIWKQ